MKVFGIAAIAAAALFSCCIMNAKEPVFKNTEWVYVEKMFVADAGTMTITHTLKFTSGKDVEVGWNSYMPSHPQMFMNPDGTVDRIPASESEAVDKGTYSYKNGTLTITLEKGAVFKYEFLNGLLVGETPYGGNMLFEKKESQEK